jgi:hypothetical protein
MAGETAPSAVGGGSVTGSAMLSSRGMDVGSFCYSHGDQAAKGELCKMQILNHGYVLQPFHNLISACQNNVLLGLRLLEKVDTFPGPTAEEVQFFQMAFGNSPSDLRQSKAQFKRWVLLNGLRDINQCIGATLQRFITFKTVESELKTNPTTSITERERELRRELDRCYTPDLVKRFNRLCSEPLVLRKEIESLNMARNCLEHSAGNVTERFCNSPQKNKLTIFGRRFKLFFEQGDEEVLAQIGIPGPENAGLYLSSEDFEIQFGLGQPIDLSLKQFLDILNTCVFLRADIETKLVA